MANLRAIGIAPAMDPLSLLSPNDLSRLLTLEATALPGAILRLNRLPRYHNGLNAIVLTARLLELRALVGTRNGSRTAKR